MNGKTEQNPTLDDFKEIQAMQMQRIERELAEQIFSPTVLPSYQPKSLTRWQSAMKRIGRAWDALCGVDYDHWY